MFKSRFKKVEVDWLDAQSSMQNLNLTDAKKKFKPIPSKSIGYLVDDQESYILLAFTYFGGEHFKHWQVIPKGMIQGEPKELK